MLKKIYSALFHLSKPLPGCARQSLGCYAKARTYFRQDRTLLPVTIKDDAWVAARSIIVPGVVIERGCTIVAGVVAAHGMANYSVVPGVPAVQTGIGEIESAATQ
ncbi:MAG: hypothetical protein QM696_04990 [Steroidobacteraceae bacterium]